MELGIRAMENLRLCISASVSDLRSDNSVVPFGGPVCRFCDANRRLDFIDPKYGCFTRICNNFSELAMVTCVDGKKYLINYPKKIIIPQEKD